MSKFIIDLQSKQLTMLDARFYYTEHGDFVPSVTTILEAYPKDAHFYKWLKEVGTDADAIRDEAGRRGSVVHQLTEMYDNGEEVSLLNTDGNLQYKMLEWSMFERYVEFCNKFKPKIIMSEQNIVSPFLGFAGTLDRVIELNGLRYLIDIKTSNVIHDQYWLQLAAYRELLRSQMGIEVNMVGILHLNAKTRTEGKIGAIQGQGWQLVAQRDSAKEMGLFIKTMDLWQEQNKDAKPKRASYTLTHKKQAI
jgi:hypothetical protein